jgi:hypothetical protein
LTQLTGCDLYQDQASYFWLGHSLGCKYIALLEFLSSENWQQIMESCVEPQAYQQVKAKLAAAELKNASILSQPSLLMAPDMSDTESAIPIRAFAHFFDRLGVGVQPTRSQTQYFIEQCQLFNLTALISFKQDAIAGSLANASSPKPIEENAVLWLFKHLQTRKFPILHVELQGKHLEPLGIKIGRYIVDFNLLDKFIELLSGRLLERHALEFLTHLRERQRQVDP